MVYLDKEAITQLVEAINQRNLDPGSKLFSDDVVLHFPGNNQVSGDYHGKSGVVEIWQKQIRLTNDTLKVEIVDTSQGEGNVILIMQISAQSNEQSYSWRRANHYKIVKGRVVEGWIYEGNQYIADKVFA